MTEKQFKVGDNNKKNESNFQFFKNLITYTFYTVFGYICLNVCVSFSLHYIAQEINQTVNAGYGFAFTCMYMIVSPIGFGVNQSLNMQTSSMLSAKQESLAKSYLNLNIYVILIVFIPLGILLLIAKYPLILIMAEEQREQTSDYSQEFLYYLIPAFILAFKFESAKCFIPIYNNPLLYIIDSLVFLLAFHILLQMGSIWRGNSDNSYRSFKCS